MKIINLIFTGIVGTSLLFGLTGCASKPSALKPLEVSASKQSKYNKYNCKQIENKLYFLKKEEKRLYNTQKEISEKDIAFASSPAILFIFPVLIGTEGDGETAKSYQRVKGELEYFKELVIEKSCNINVNKSNIEVEYN